MTVSMFKMKNSANIRSSAFLVAGILTALGASICCLGPLLLLTIGVSGAWISSLTALEPYRPIFIGLTLLSFAFAGYRLYFAKELCAPGSLCANPRTLKHQRLAFWIVAVFALSLIVAPWIAPLFYSI
jgi:mercuric ion transport protein